MQRSLSSSYSSTRPSFTCWTFLLLVSTGCFFAPSTHSFSTHHHTSTSATTAFRTRKFELGSYGHERILRPSFSCLSFSPSSCCDNNDNLQIWVEEAEEGFVDEDENLEDDEICLLAIKAFASSDSTNKEMKYNLDKYSEYGRTSDNESSVAEEHDDDENKRFLCAGALVQRPSHHPLNYNDPTPTLSTPSICDAWIADTSMEEGTGGPNLQIQGALQTVDTLFCEFLKHEYHHSISSTKEGFNNKWKLFLQCGSEESEYTCASYRAALLRGFLPHHEEDGMVFHPEVGISRYTSAAIEMAGTSSGNQMLKILSYLSRKRTTFDSSGEDQHGDEKYNSEHDDNRNDNQEQSKRNYSDERILGQISNEKELLSSETVGKINDIFQEIQRIDANNQIEEEDCICMDLDSVDGLPSGYLPFVVQGEPLSRSESNDDDSSVNDNDSDGGDCSRTLCQIKSMEIYNLIEDIVEGPLLEKAQKMLSRDDKTDGEAILEVSDVFIRSYGQPTNAVDDGMEYRFGIPAHYDVFTGLTAVIALDDCAKNGDSGLYTVLAGSNGEGGANHAGLRRYFQLSAGDAVLHSREVQHGVDMKIIGKDSNQNRRTSLIIWYAERGREDENKPAFEGTKAVSSSIQSLVQAHLMNKSNDVTSFILASALESLTMEGVDFGKILMDSKLDINDLYISSAQQGNPNALSRLGSLSVQQKLSTKHVFKILEMLDKANSVDPLYSDFTQTGEISDIDEECFTTFDEDCIEPDSFARRLWMEAAKKGNEIGQLMLADSIIESFEDDVHRKGDDVKTSPSKVIACVLYALALQQNERYHDENLNFTEFLSFVGISNEFDIDVDVESKRNIFHIFEAAFI